MIFLSFCRGSVGKIKGNRTNESWECKTLPGLANISSFSPVRRPANKQELEGMKQSHPFPSFNIPANCYICFSTLPDSL